MGNPAFKYDPLAEEEAADDAAAAADAAAEEAAAEQAAQSAARLTLVQSSEAATVAEAGATGVEAGEGLSVGAGIGATFLSVAAAALILFWPSKIAPEPRMGPPPAPKNPPQPNPKPLKKPCPPPAVCKQLIDDLRDAVERNKRNFGNKGMHGLVHRLAELINGPCGPGQLPYRVNSRGQYVKTPVWENHVDEFNRTKNALRNRFAAVVNSGCADQLPDDLLDDVAKAESTPPPTPNQWKGDPKRPCLDSAPPNGWQGPVEATGSRGL
jgi:hypothetical protein